MNKKYPKTKLRFVLFALAASSTACLGEISIPDLDEVINGADGSDAGVDGPDGVDGGSKPMDTPGLGPSDGGEPVDAPPPSVGDARAPTPLDAGMSMGPPDPPEEEPAVDPVLVEKGRKLYTSKCTFCHGADGSGGPVEVPLTDVVDEDKLTDTIDRTMPKGAADTCDEACSRALAVYIRATFVRSPRVVEWH